MDKANRTLRVVATRDDDADQPPVLVVEDALGAANNSPADQVQENGSGVQSRGSRATSPNLLGTEAANPPVPGKGS